MVNTRTCKMNICKICKMLQEWMEYENISDLNAYFTKLYEINLLIISMECLCVCNFASSHKGLEKFSVGPGKIIHSIPQ